MPSAELGRSPVVRFDDFELDLEAALLRRRGVHVRLREKAFQVLAALLAQPGQVVGELQAWPRARCVSLAAYSAARKALTASLMRGASQRKAT
jgi:DNA-binding response OmpR family regulator